MNTRLLLLVGAILLQLVLGLSPFLPWISQHVAPPDADVGDRLSIERTFMGIYMAVLTAYVGVVFLRRDSDEEKFKTNLLTEVGRLHAAFAQIAQVRLIKDDEFYGSFLAAARAATDSVSISYFDVRPPKSHMTEREAYYQQMLDVIKKSRGVRFRRLIRDTPANRAWALQLCEELDRCHHADIALLSDTSVQEVGSALSVQVVDTKVTWLVAINSHERVDKFRDVRVDSAEFGEAMTQYYNRLWRMGKPVLTNGEPTEEYYALKQKATAGGTI
jgi:hypothetical protein